MFCRSCGTNLPDGSQFCTKCGTVQTPMPQQSPVFPNQPVYPAQPVYQPQPSKNNSKKLIAIILALVALVGVLVGVLVWSLTAKGDADQEEDSSYFHDEDKDNDEDNDEDKDNHGDGFFQDNEEEDQTNAPATPGETTAENIPDEKPSYDGKYQIAFIADVGAMKDNSFNQLTFNGVKLYASANGKSFRYYQLANGNNSTDDDRLAAMVQACENGAEVVVATGFMQEFALREAANMYPNVHFIFMDGYVIYQDPYSLSGNALSNVAAFSFQEEEAGYLAGYAAVMEGYTKLGFMGGGGGSNPACMRYGYGFVQGAETAASILNIEIDINYSWLYGAAFSASKDLQALATDWYQHGTEVIFVCGGGMFASVHNAASAEGGKIIGVDVDQSYQSPYVITSAMKDITNATVLAIAQHYEGNWDNIGGQCTVLGAADNAVCLPTDTWPFHYFSRDDYDTLLLNLITGNLPVDSALVEYPARSKYVNIIPVQ